MHLKYRHLYKRNKPILYYILPNFVKDFNVLHLIDRIPGKDIFNYNE